jgi:hypothetical protein
VVAAICSQPEFGFANTGEILRSKKPCFFKDVDHEIVIVGYSDTGTKDDFYWIIKNSAGTDWGEGGFGKVGQSDLGIRLHITVPEIRDSPCWDIDLTDAWFTEADAEEYSPPGKYQTPGQIFSKLDLRNGYYKKAQLSSTFDQTEKIKLCNSWCFNEDDCKAWALDKKSCYLKNKYDGTYRADDDHWSAVCRP